MATFSVSHLQRAILSPASAVTQPQRGACSRRHVEAPLGGLLGASSLGGSTDQRAVSHARGRCQVAHMNTSVVHADLLGRIAWRSFSGCRSRSRFRSRSLLPHASADQKESQIPTSTNDDVEPMMVQMVQMQLGQEEKEEEAGKGYKRTNGLMTAAVIGGSVLAAAAAFNLDWVAQHQSLAMAAVFTLGYGGIIFEESLAFNKSAVGLTMAVALWAIRSIVVPSDIAVAELSEQASSVSEIVYFLLGAMTIVEIVDSHQGFKIITDVISTKSNRILLWTIGFITFFLSSILDNLTTTIVMVSLLRKLVPDAERRKYFGAVVVIAANAGGAWTPIGDVTTTMLWIHGQISTIRTMQDIFLPSMACLVVPLAIMSFASEMAEGKPEAESVMVVPEPMAPKGELVFAGGLGALLFVPAFKALTGLPPYMGILFGLGMLWLLTDAIHFGESGREKLRVPQALNRIDTQGILFFLGILLSIGCLESAGLLKDLAAFLGENIPSLDLIASAIGLASAVIDNVPLVAATMGMYNLSEFPMDDRLWQLIAYCAGTGGSILIIGSAAGVAYMGMEKADFFWYLKKVSFPAFAGYGAGIAIYLLTHQAATPALQTVIASLPQLQLS